MKNKISNQCGSALLPVLLIAASAVVTALIMLQSSASINDLYAKKALSSTADNTSQTIGSVVNDPNVCLTGFDGAGPGAGMEFLPNGTFDIAAVSATGQDVRIPNSNGPAFGAGTAIPGTSLTISRLYLTPVSQTGTDYTVALNISFSTGANGPGLSPRTIFKLKVQTNGAGGVTGCGPAPQAVSNQTLCEGMGCDYSTSTSGEGTCLCPIQPVTCSGGTYIQSIVSNTAVCSSGTITRTCAPNGYMVALDGNGNAVCATVTSCPAGTSSTGLGGVSSVAGCKCNTLGETWTAATSSCSAPAVPINGVCGTANGQSLTSPPTTSAQFCTSGAQANFQGSGPWNWNCNGANGGSSVSCTANLTTGSTLSCYMYGWSVATYDARGGSATGGGCGPFPDSGSCESARSSFMSGVGGNASSSSCTATSCMMTGQCFPGYPATSTNGVCSVPAGTTISQPVTASTGCSSGTAINIVGTAPGGFTWICQGGGGGSSQNCSATVSCAADGQMSPNFWATGQDDAACSGSMPAGASYDNACCSGTSYPAWGPGDLIGGSGCQNICGPVTSSPWASCGLSNGISSVAQPSGLNACFGGTIQNMTGSGPWNWKCQAMHNTTTCTAPLQGATCSTGWAVVSTYSAPRTQADLGSGNTKIESSWDLTRNGMFQFYAPNNNTDVSSTYAQQADGNMRNVGSTLVNADDNGDFADFNCTTDRAGYVALNVTRHVSATGVATWSETYYRCTCP